MYLHARATFFSEAADLRVLLSESSAPVNKLVSSDSRKMYLRARKAFLARNSGSTHIG